MTDADEAYDRLHGVDGHVQARWPRGRLVAHPEPGKVWVQVQHRDDIASDWIEVDELPECSGLCGQHHWLDRPESDSRECLICGEEVFG